VLPGNKKGQTGNYGITIASGLRPLIEGNQKLFLSLGGFS